MIEIGIIEEKVIVTTYKKGEDQEQNQRLGNEHCLHKENDKGFVFCFVSLLVRAWELAGRKEFGNHISKNNCLDSTNQRESHLWRL